MPWIHNTLPTHATGPIAVLYERMRLLSPTGRISNFWQIYGSDPHGLETLYELYMAIWADPAPLTAAQADLVALVVSATNGCGYCVSHRGPKLVQSLMDESLARSVAMDYRAANLPARERVMLDYAVALTCEPAERTQEDIERLREYGFDDPAIHKITVIAAFYNMVARIANPLGVELEPGVEEWEFGAQK